MAGREDGADVGLLEQVPLHAAHQKVLFADDREIPRPYAEQPDVGASDRARQLDAGVDGHFLSAQQADLPAEERVYVSAGRRDPARGRL